MWMYLINGLHSDCFDNLNRVENVVNCLSVIDLYQFLLHIYILVVVMFRFFQEKNLIFCGISTVVFRVINSGGVFLLSVSGIARFFPAVQTICMFGNFIKIN